MASNDEHLYHSLRIFLAEKLFNGVEEVKTCLNHCFAYKAVIFYYYCSTHIHKKRKDDVPQSNRFYTTDLSYPNFKILRFHLVDVFSHAKWANLIK